MFSLRGNLLRTMLRVSHSALPLQRSITCGSRISPSSLPLFSVFVCVQSFSSLGNLGTGDYIVRWLSRISTIVCGECMEANLFYKFVREQTVRRTMQRKIQMLRILPNNPKSTIKTIEKQSKGRMFHRVPWWFSQAVRILSSRKKWRRGSERNWERAELVLVVNSMVDRTCCWWESLHRNRWRHPRERCFHHSIDVSAGY